MAFKASKAGGGSGSGVSSAMDVDPDDADGGRDGAFATELGPVSGDPNWKRISAGLDALDENKALLETLAESLRTQPYSSRLQRSLNQLRVAATSQCTDLHFRFMRIKPSQLERYRSLAVRFQELTGAINELTIRCTALTKSTTPLMDPDSPKKRARARKFSDTSKTPELTGPTASGSGSGSGSRASPNTSPALKPNSVAALPPAQYQAFAEGQSLLTAGVATPAPPPPEVIHGGSGPAGSGVEPDPKALTDSAMFAQLKAVPWTEDEQGVAAAQAQAERAAALAADVQQIEQMVRQVHEMFGDLAQIVASQQQPIEQVAEHVAEAKHQAEQALSQLSKASRYKSFGLALGGALVGGLLGGPLGFAAGAKAGLGVGLVGGALLGGGAGRLVGASLRADAKSADRYLEAQREKAAAEAAATATATAAAPASPSASVSLSDLKRNGNGRSGNHSSGSGLGGSGGSAAGSSSPLSGSGDGFVAVSGSTPLAQSFLHIPSASNKPSVQSLALSTPSLAGGSGAKPKR